MKVITKDFITNVLSKDNAACASIRSGETVVFETYDCFTNQFLPEEATFENVVRKPGNPATGPLYIEGAMPGDMLRIEILDIELGPVGIVMLGPGSGSERTEFPEKILKRVPVKDGKAYYDGKVEIPVEPMIGVIGVAPAAEGVSTITPMDHGGNMDCTQIKKGAVLYLPVFVEGGLLSMGDFHAIMGDGEVEDCGLEIEGRATVHVDVVRNQYCVPYPMIETEDRLITIASAEALDLYQQKNPLATLNIYHGMSIEVAQGVSCGKYDIGFCSMVDDMPDLVFVPITYQELIAIVQDNHPLADRGAMYLSDLKDYRLTTYRDTIPIGKVVRRLLKEKGVEAVYSYDDEISIAGRISKSSKVAIVADTPYLRQFNNLSKVRLLDVPKDTRMIYMVYSRKNFITSAVEAFANFMVANCLNMPD